MTLLEKLEAAAGQEYFNHDDSLVGAQLLGMQKKVASNKIVLVTDSSPKNNE